MSTLHTLVPHALALGLAATGLLALGCTRNPAASPGRPNVLLVTIDTLRADHVGCYGHPGLATPVLDGLASRGVRFGTAVAHVPLTAPSHASILTGRTPLGHGLRDNGGFALPDDAKSLAEDFRQAGYRTAAFVSGFPLDRRFGFDRGFQTYDDHLPRGNDPRRTPYVERTADRTTEAVLKWLEAAPAGAAAFFLWVHYYDPHAPYEPPAELLARFPSSPYDGEIAFVDAQLGRLLRRLDDLSPQTVVLVTADHGEGLGEHGEETHGLFVYDATLRVPWIMAGPGLPSGRVASVVARGIDVAPTLLDYAGLPARADIEGRSLRAAADGRDQGDAPAYAESLFPQLQYGWAPLHAWRTARFKFIEAPRPELYDLGADGGETRDRAREEQGRVGEMRRQLRAAMSTRTPSAAKEMDAETAERLGALGYLGGGHAPAAGAAPRDPKDGVQLVARLGRGMATARTEPAVAIRELTAVLAEDPKMLVARRTRAVAYAAAGQHAAAIADLRRLESEGHLSTEDSIVLGDNLRFAGRSGEAIRVLERTARENPKFAQAGLSLAEVFIKEGRKADAAAAYERVLGLVPDHIEALRGLGDLALFEGQLEAAAARYGRILEMDAADAGAMTKLGVVKVRSGRADEGIALFRKAVEREPRNAEALLYLAGALASGGRSAEAIPYFERALAAGPRSPMALNGLGLTRLALGDSAAAATAFRESLRLDPDQPDVAKTLRDLGRR
jgi:choline-sulfatase